MTWILLAIIALLVLFNVPSTRPHAQRVWNAVRGWRPRWWMVAIAILAIPIVLPSIVPWARAQGERVLAVWNGTPPAATTKQEAGGSPSAVDPQKVYSAAKEGTKEGATEAVKAEAPKIAEAAKSGASDGAAKAANKPAAPAQTPTPAPTPSQPTAPALTTQQSDFLVNAIITSSDAAKKAQAEAEKAKTEAEKAQAEAMKAKEAKEKAEAAQKVAEAEAAKAKAEAAKAASSATKADETARFSFVVANGTASASGTDLVGKYFWYEYRPCGDTGSCQTQMFFGRVSASRDAATQSRNLPAGGYVRVLIEDPNGTIAVNAGGQVYKTSPTEWKPNK